MKKIYALIILLTLLLFYVSKSQSSLPDSNSTPPPTEADLQVQQQLNDSRADRHNLFYELLVNSSLSPYEFILCVLLLLFAFLLFILYIFLFWKERLQSHQIVKLSLITLIIFSTLFLITAGYSNDQIAPATGLLGTIAGYILGKQNPNSTNPVNHQTNQQG